MESPASLSSSVLPPLIIPAYEPDGKLVGLVRELLSMGFSQILVVDDGSSLEKRKVFNLLQQIPGVTLLRHAVNLGKGAALKTAFNHLLVSLPESKGAVTVDADGQHLPEDVKRVAIELTNHENALVLGARTFQKDVPLRSRFGNILTGYVFHFLVGKKLQDTQTGLRGVPVGLMRKLLVLTTSRYEFELDMLIAATRSHVVLREVAISTVYEDGNKSSHFNPLLDSFRIYFIFLRFISLSLLTYAADLLIFTVVYRMSRAMFLSVVCGRALGAVVSVIGSKFFVFKSDKKFGELGLKFFALWLSLLGLSYGLMLLFVNLGCNVYISRILVDSLLFLLNFLVQRDLIFTPGDSETA